jgi:hypothetical protein
MDHERIDADLHSGVNDTAELTRPAKRAHGCLEADPPVPPTSRGIGHPAANSAVEALARLEDSIG